MANNRLRFYHPKLPYQECPVIMKYYPGTGWYFSFDDLEEMTNKLNDLAEANGLSPTEFELDLETDEGVAQ